MKQNEVKVGMTCYCNVGNTLAEVVVVREIPADRFNTRVRYEVKRPGETRSLPGYRTAAALRTENRKFF